MISGFGDPAANEEVCRFIRGQIAKVVEDPEKARKVMPTGVFACRPICESGYFQVLNRDSVHVVSLKETPISAITPTGILTSDGTAHPLDIIIFATGFNAIEGSYVRFPNRKS